MNATPTRNLTHTRELTVGGPATGWTVTLEETVNTYTVTLHTNDESITVMSGDGMSQVYAWHVYEHVTATGVFVDAWNRAVNA
jgi:hypothetical protein